MPRKPTDTTPVQDSARASTVKDTTRAALENKLVTVAPTLAPGWPGWAGATVAVLSTAQVPLHAASLPMSQDGMAIYALEPGTRRAVLEYTVTAMDAGSPGELAAYIVGVVLAIRERMAGPERGD